ncbi:MAG: ABC transporter permease [Propionibacteriaceae bacterium]|nr:ABC transporter permease [Propionibacteriaceae bacterium]
MVSTGGRDNKTPGTRTGDMQTRLVWQAVFFEAWASLGQNPVRTILTMLGTALGVGAFVTVLGLTATAQGQISNDFSQLQATTVVVNDAGTDPMAEHILSFPLDAEARMNQLNGVVAGGLSWAVPSGNSTVSKSLDARDKDHRLELYAASSGYITGLHPTWAAGTAYSQFASEQALPVVVVGVVAARQLDLHQAGVTIAIGGSLYQVAGIIATVERKPELLSAILLPTTTALNTFGPPVGWARAHMLVETELGAAYQVAGELALALRPDNPATMAVVPPPNPPLMAGLVSASLQTLFISLAGVTLLIGATAIANTTMVAVMERVGEIGVRRAIGAGRAHIMTQFLIETTLTGLVAGVVGASLGVLVVAAVALASTWTAIMPGWVIASGPIIGGAVGLLAGTFPAWRAGNISPMTALRR